MTAAQGTAPPRHLLRSASLFLDFDGTLVELAERPDAVIVTERLQHLLARLVGSLNGRLAIISGRPAGQVRSLIGDLSCTIVGSHGLEILRPDGAVRQRSAPARVEQIVAAMEGFARSHPGVLVERKPFGAALHYRTAPGAEQACLGMAEALAGSDMVLQPGKMVIELRAPGSDKGQALLRLLDEPFMAGARPVFLGDDLTDEPAFTAADARGGAGILVGEPRATAARYRLGSVHETLDWLEQESEGLA